MYSFGERKDTSIVDEPFYAHYLNKTEADHPMREEVLKSQNASFDAVVKKVYQAAYHKEHVFFKQMSHHMCGKLPTFAVNDKNILLIREPKGMILSFTKIIDSPTIEDLGLPSSVKLFHYFEENGHPPIVLDTAALSKNPKRTMQKLCAQLGLQFEKGMLRWKSGTRKEDGVWAKVWYLSLHKSTGLKVKKGPSMKLPEKYDALYRACLPYYSFLRERSIQ